MDHLNLQEREFHFTKIIKAPAERVYLAWTDEIMLAKWWGPDCYTNYICEFDPQPNGEIYIEMSSPEGKTYPLTGKVREALPSRSLIFTLSAVGNNAEALVTDLNSVTFTEAEGVTTINLTVQVEKVVPKSASYLDGVEEKWKQSLNKLEVVLTDIGLNALN